MADCSQNISATLSVVALQEMETLVDFRVPTMLAAAAAVQVVRVLMAYIAPPRLEMVVLE
jgi:hypothetical protein